MGKLERAKIYVLSGDGSGAKDDSQSIDVCFNPKEYSLAKTVAWDTEKAFSDAPQPEFTKPAPMTLTVTLQFDTYEERCSVRDKYTKKIETLGNMRGPLTEKASKADKEKASPPVILFVWGRFTFKGVITQIGSKYTMFLADGTPVRAEIALTLQNVWDTSVNDDPNNPTPKGGSGGKSYTVKDGDRLDSIAASQLGDASRWIEIASLNNIDDPQSITAGTPLQLPD
jgi:nucleoid-associated protein YgaU